jgi:hypothetical protein
MLTQFHKQGNLKDKSISALEAVPFACTIYDLPPKQCTNPYHITIHAIDCGRL